MTKWFYQLNQIVKGPVSTTELQNLIPSMPDVKKTYVWSRGYSEWVTADLWKPGSEIQFTEQPKNIKPDFKPELKHVEQHKPIPDAADEITKTTASPATVKTELQINTEKTNPIIQNISEEKFRVQLNFIDQGRMTKNELFAYAAKCDDPAQIAVFDNQLKEWKEIYAFKDVVEKLGLTRRKHPRVPILAQFTGSTSRHDKFTARLVTISIGGLGLTEVFDLKIGDKIYGQITSPHFYSAVAIEAEATYCGNDGYVGLKFSQINDESQSLVTDYVKRFST